MRLAIAVALMCAASLSACKKENEQMGLTNWENAPPLVGSEVVGGVTVAAADEGAALPGGRGGRGPGAPGGRGGRGGGRGDMTPEQQAAMRERMANMTPEERAAMQARGGAGRPGGRGPGGAGRPGAPATPPKAPAG